MPSVSLGFLNNGFPISWYDTETLRGLIIQCLKKWVKLLFCSSWPSSVENYENTKLDLRSVPAPRKNFVNTTLMHTTPRSSIYVGWSGVSSRNFEFSCFVCYSHIVWIILIQIDALCLAQFADLHLPRISKHELTTEPKWRPFLFLSRPSEPVYCCPVPPLESDDSWGRWWRYIWRFIKTSPCADTNRHMCSTSSVESVNEGVAEIPSTNFMKYVMEFLCCFWWTLLLSKINATGLSWKTWRGLFMVKKTSHCR